MKDIILKFLSRASLILACLVLAAAGDPLPLLWNVPGGVYVDSCPAIDPNGNIYVTASGSTKYYDFNDGELAAIDSHGRKKWAFKTTSDIKSSPAIGADGTIYFGCRDRKLYAITPEGKLRWSFATGAWVDSSPAIGADGVIYTGSWDGKFYALNPDGTKKWEFATGGPVDSSPAIGTDGTIYFGSHDTKFYALKPNGTQKWNLKTDGAVISSPAVGGDGVIYFTSVDGRLYAANPDGSVKWRFWTGGVGTSSPVVDANGTAYAGVDAGGTNMFFAVGSDGTKKWWFGYPEIRGAAALTADGLVYFPGTDSGVGRLYGWSTDGKPQSGASLDGMVTGSPAVAPDGTIYLGSMSSICTAFKGGAGLARGGWPKFRGNAAQNGRASSN